MSRPQPLSTLFPYTTLFRSALAGGLAHGNTRILLWVGSVCVDLLGGIVGFATPGLGRSRTSDWTIEGGHFAERDRKSTRLNSSHPSISYAVFCLKKKTYNRY